MYITYTFQRSNLRPTTVEYEIFQEHISQVVSHNVVTYK